MAPPDQELFQETAVKQSDSHVFVPTKPELQSLHIDRRNSRAYKVNVKGPELNQR